MIEVKEMISKYEKLLPVGTSISYTEAERRASEFLVAMAYITAERHRLSEQKIKSLSIQTVTYALKLSEGTANTITQNKITAEASKEYVDAREELERIDNDLSYLRAYYDVFNNAHLFYRQMAKGDNG